MSKPRLSTFTIQDDVFEPAQLTQIEIDLIGSPEFQRLFRVSQMGFVDLVYPSANHTRAIHSIGCCSWAKKLISVINRNNTKSIKEWDQIEISPAESTLISIGALLHDLSHGPFAHDIEKKSHLIYPFESDYPSDLNLTVKIKSAYGPYEKHDDYVKNPVLYITLLDTETSILARVLRRHSPSFWEAIKEDSLKYDHLQKFVSLLKQWERNGKWPNLSLELLPQLVFHLFAFEKFEDGRTKNTIRLAKSFDFKESDWGLGPSGGPHEELHEAWYQPYRHDIIGDTLSADLLDYLHRDLARLGFARSLDLKLLDSYLIIPVSEDNQIVRRTKGNERPLFEESGKIFYRCALDLEDSKRGSVRMERLNDLFRLLDLRHEIHEKAVFHRIVQAGIAMLSRAILRLPPDTKPELKAMYGFDRDSSPAMFGDDHFLEQLVQIAREQPEYRQNRSLMSQSIPQKLAERRIYRPLMMVPGDRVVDLLESLPHIERNPVSEQKTLRELAAIVDSQYFRPFFCFVSKCIDEMLQHVVSNPDAVMEEVKNDVGRLNSVIDARPPKHVIFWALPYKQLYKDPEIVARVGSCVGTIEELLKDRGVSQFVRSRISAGLNETESKYTTLWKFYVFLSDGLFYTGPVALLLENACSDDIGNGSSHYEHLKQAQLLVIRSLRASWEHWSHEQLILKNHSNSLEKTANLLQNEPSPDALRQMIATLQRENSARDAELVWERVVSCSLETYVHSRDDNGHITDGCRDIRYKYDSELTGTFKERLTEFGLNREKRRLIMRILESSNRQPSGFGKEEFNYLVNRLAAASTDRLAECLNGGATRKQAAREEDRRINWQALQDVLRDPKGDNNWESGFSLEH